MCGCCLVCLCGLVVASRVLLSGVSVCDVVFMVCCRIYCVGVAVYLCVRGLICSCVLSPMYCAMLYDVFFFWGGGTCACCLMCFDAVFVNSCVMMHVGCCVCYCVVRLMCLCVLILVRCSMVWCCVFCCFVCLCLFSNVCKCIICALLCGVARFVCCCVCVSV